MTTRCRQYAMECARDAFNADGSQDGDSIEFMESLICVADSFEAKGIDEELAAAEEDASFSAAEYSDDDDPEEEDEYDMEAYLLERDRIERETATTKCVQLADHYMSEGSRWFDEWDILLSLLDDSDGAVTDATEVVRWYLFQLAVKLRRAINGKLDDEMECREDMLGSAKVVLVGADSSLQAWELLQSRMPEDKADAISPILAVLRQLVVETEAEVPDARDFVRPGLDD